jgi:hygromycin-B 4-O-kinase
MGRGNVIWSIIIIYYLIESMSGNVQKSELMEIKEFLKNVFNDNVFSIRPIKSGERSKAFIFETKRVKYIFRINNQDIGFRKDKYAYKHFSKFAPIPEVVKIGQFKEQFYSISQYCIGKTLTDSNTVLPSLLINSLFTTLDELQNVPIPNNAKYGITNVNGEAKYSSWEKWILKKNIMVTKNDGSFYSWDEVKTISFVERNIIDELFNKVERLIPFIPKEKYLIHGDYGPGNIMIDNDRVTGVIDWNEYAYGDFLFDVAWLDFWINKTDFINEYKVHFQKNGKYIRYYTERMMCHKLFIGVNTLGIYAAIGWEEGYMSTLERINRFIN